MEESIPAVEDAPDGVASPESSGPNPVDVHVGARVRERRKQLEISQVGLAAELGLTFQQVQKYERGANRVSASKLFDIARVLKTSIESFYEGLAPTVDENPALVRLAPPPAAIPRSNDMVELARHLAVMPVARRRLIVRVAQALVAD